MRRTCIISWLAAGALGVLVASAWWAPRGVFAAAEPKYEGPWPAKVPGHVPPQPGEHPRLLFRKGDLPALRQRAQTPEGQAILKRLRFLLNGGDGETMPKARRPLEAPYGDKSEPIEQPVGAYSIGHAAGFGLLWQLTGDRKYAELGRQCFEWAFEGYRDRDDKGRYSFKQPTGALRAGPSLGWYAVGYDLCADGWDDAFRRKVAEALAGYSEGDNQSLEELVRGSRHMPGSNHWGMQVGGGALAVLAVMGDGGADAGRIAKLLEESSKSMVRNVTEGFGDHGWFAEGDGTGSMSSTIVYLTAIQAWRTAGGLDFVSPRPNVPWTTLKWVFLTVPRGGKPDFPQRGGYPHNIWARDGLSGGGYFAIGFGALIEDQKAAALWFYDRFLRDYDAKAGTPFDTVCIYPQVAVMSFVNWPLGLSERNPAEVLPQAVRDAKYGFYMFRNRWQDDNDVVVSIQTQSTRGWIKADTKGDVVVWGMGRKQNWGRMTGKEAHWAPEPDGSAVLTMSGGTSLAVDFTKASGAEAMLVMTGPGAPGGGETVTVGGAKLSFLFLGGKAPTPQVQGDKVIAGGQTIRFDGRNLVLGK